MMWIRVLPPARAGLFNGVDQEAAVSIEFNERVTGVGLWRAMTCRRR